MKDGLTPVTIQNVSGSVSNNLSKLEKEHYALQRYARRSNVEILGYQISLLGIVWRKKLLNYVMMLVLLLKSETLNLVIDCFKKKVTISCPTLPGKCPELFWVILVRIFPHSDWIWRYSTSFRIQYRCGKMRNRTTPNTDTFYAVQKNYCKVYQ